jgi:hypothetical protein
MRRRLTGLEIQEESPAEALPTVVEGWAGRRAGWPLTVMLVLYPLWWALGMGTLIVFLLAVPMAVHLRRRGSVQVPPAFGMWLLFLVWVVASAALIGLNPPGTVSGLVLDRAVSVAFNLAGYLSVTIVLLYVGNLSEREYPRERVVRHLALLFVVTVAGGLLGTFAPTFGFTSLVEYVLPHSVAQNTFVQSIVHPAAAQVQQVLGYTSGRPAAPFGYTNTWGYVLNLLIGWFALCWLRRGGPWRIGGVLILVVSLIPIVQSLNRGLWIGLAATVLFVVFWLARSGHLGALVGLLVCLALTLGILVASPLTGVIQDRLSHQKSNGIRAFTTVNTLQVVEHSPVLGFGSTRRAMGSSNSITVGRSAKCTNCGNPVLGSNGQLWLVLIAHGVGGALLYLGYFLRTMWAFRRDRSALAGAAMLAIALPFLYMFVYNAVVIPLLITFLSIGLLWRNAQQEPDEAVVAPVPEPAPLWMAR